jgi:hypothetical protein
MNLEVEIDAGAEKKWISISLGVASLSRIKRFGVRQHGEFGSISNAELAINMVQMDFDSPLGQP